MNLINVFIKSSSFSVINSIVNVTQVFILYSVYDQTSINNYLVYLSLFLTVDLICSYQISNFIGREKFINQSLINSCSKFESFNFIALIPIVIFGVLTTDASYSLLFVCITLIFRNLYTINGVLRRRNAEYIYFISLLGASFAKLFTVLIEPKIEIIIFLFCVYEIISVLFLNFILKLKYDISLFLIPKFDLLLFKRIFPLNAHQYANIPFNQMDVIILNHFFTEVEVNAYKFARRVVGFIGRIINPLNNIFLNSLVIGKHGVRKIFLIAFILGVFILFVLFFLQNKDLSGIEIIITENIKVNSFFILISLTEALLLVCSTIYMLILYKKADKEYLLVIVIANLTALVVAMLGYNVVIMFSCYVIAIFLLSSLVYVKK